MKAFITDTKSNALRTVYLKCKTKTVLKQKAPVMNTNIFFFLITTQNEDF